MSQNSKPTNSTQDEVSLLAGIGSTLQESNKYETQVLREATQSHAPKLTGVGFPDLSELAPSYSTLVANDESKASNKRRKMNGTTPTSRNNISDKKQAPPGDIPHILKVLSNVKLSLDNSSAASENRQTQILRIKRQILLTYLATHTNLSKDEVGINIAKEVRDEERRKDNLIRQGKQESRKGKKMSTIVTNYNHDAPGGDANSARKPGRHSKRATQRLERIKLGEIEDDAIDVFSKSSTASFGKQALVARNASIEHSKRKGSTKKLSMMAMKRKLVEEEGETWVDPEALWKRRLARLERRRFRKSSGGLAKSKASKVEVEVEGESNIVVLSPNVSDEVKGDAIDLPFNSEVMETTDERVEKNKPLSSVVKIETSDENLSGSQRTSTINVQCSICEEILAIPDEWSKDPDTFLSQHMQQCQQTADGQSRSIRRSRRKTTKPVTYKDDEDLDLSKNQSSKQIRAVKGFVDDEDVGDVESSEDEILIEEKVTKNELDELSERSGNENAYTRNKAIDDFDVDDYEDRIDDWIECGIQSMRDMDEQDQDEVKPGAATYAGGLEIPAWVNDRLFGYQRTALRWLWELHQQEAGGIVGDEMGLGKTVQVCSYLGAMAASRKLRSVLVISPATMLSHWLSELSKWAPGFRRILVHKSAERRGDTRSRSVNRRMLSNLDKWLGRARADRINEPIDEKDLLENGADSFCGTGYVVLTTFENVRRACDIWTGHQWSYVVMDEGQKIRNPDAEVTIACKRLRTPHRLLLSGTPIQNDLRELWSLFDFVFPGRLGTLPVFLSEFADPIKRGGYSNASPMQVQLAYRCALVLRDLINPFLLRRQKKDIKEVSRMPGKTEQVLFCKLSRRQRSMYEAYLRSDDVVNIIRGSAQCFKPIIMLRKICNHPDLICRPNDEYESFLKNGFVNENDMDDISSDEGEFDIENSDKSTLVDRSGKLEVLAKILPLWKKQGHRVLIFSQWKKMLDIIQHFMNIHGYKFGRLDGNTNVAARQRLVDTFNNDDSYFAMLLTTKTGGVGLNLTGGNRIIIYDPDWNPQSDAQARERAWRFGQKNAVTVYRLITAGTIEEKIYQRQIFKMALTNQVLADPRQRRMFSQKDLRDLFTLKADVDSVSKGGGGVTETGELTKGRGVMDVEEGTEEAECLDDKETMVEVLKSKGLAGVFDHDVVDKPYAKKSSTVREMEHEAHKVVRRAARSLAESTDETQQPFVPTWTGSTETEPRRFGGISKIGNNGPYNNGLASKPRKPPTFDSGFGGASSAGLGMGGGAVSSTALLAQVQQRRKEIESGGATVSIVDTKEESFAIDLMKRIRLFIKRYLSKSDRGPSTAQILAEFNDVKDSDAVLFKSILKQVAVVSSGRWELR